MLVAARITNNTKARPIYYKHSQHFVPGASAAPVWVFEKSWISILSGMQRFVLTGRMLHYGPFNAQIGHKPDNRY